MIVDKIIAIEDRLADTDWTQGFGDTLTDTSVVVVVTHMHARTPGAPYCTLVCELTH